MNRLDQQRQKAQAKGNHVGSPPKPKGKPSGKTKGKKRTGPFKGDRLPAGSSAEGRWDGENWRGILRIPQPDGTVQEFTAEANKQYTLWARLDKAYRNSLEK